MAVQPFGQRVSLWFGRIDADIGGNRRQKLVTAENQGVIKAPQRCVVGGMALAKADQPAATARRYHIALSYPGEAHGQRRHDIGKVEGPFLRLGLTLFRLHPGALVEQQ